MASLHAHFDLMLNSVPLGQKLDAINPGAMLFQALQGT